MDLFEKCDHFETLKQVRQMGIYPYFHELESRQAPDRDDGEPSRHHAGQ